MAKGIIGQTFTFTCLFLDSEGIPFTPDDPTIEVFYFNSTGVKQTLVSAGTALVPVSGDTGRYRYTIMISTQLTEALQLYGVMQGNHPTTDERITFEQPVDLFNPDGSACSGMRVAFLRPGGWP